jgi:hypothetical protein
MYMKKAALAIMCLLDVQTESLSVSQVFPFMAVLGASVEVQHSFTCQ